MHFIGIGGIGMSALARVMVAQGVPVSGSDIRENQVIEDLRSLGVSVFIGHDASHVDGASEVVFSTAIKEENSELRRAKELDIPLVHRGELLARIINQRRGVTIAGAHGKTTCSAMAGVLLTLAGWEPTVLVGGRIHQLGSNGWLGKGEFVVAEADESDGSFLMLHPWASLVTNVDREHLDHYGSWEAIKDAFRRYLTNIREVAVVCGDDPFLKGEEGCCSARWVTYGFSDENTYSCAKIVSTNGIQRYSVLRKGEELGEVTLPLLGRHNVLNSLGVVALLLEVGLPFSEIVKGLREFKGVDRRLTKKGEARGVLVIDDYGHHPTELRATLRAVVEGWPGRRVKVLFQPHRYSRTKSLLEEFWGAFVEAHGVFVLPIYPAGERPNGVSHTDVARGIRKESCTNTLEVDGDPVAFLTEHLQEGDILITMGAGDVWKIGEELVRRLGA